MARIKWKNPNNQLRGTFGGLVYKMRYGKQFVYSQPMPYLPKHPTKEQKAKHERLCIIQDCVCEIQLFEYAQGIPTVERMQQIADKYNTIRISCERLYDRIWPRFRSEGNWIKLKDTIVYWYKFKKFPPEFDFLLDFTESM